MSRSEIIVFTIMFTGIFFTAAFAFAVIFDVVLSVGTPGKPVVYDCVDGDGGVNLEGIKCEKKVLCSKLGLAAQYKCNSEEWRALDE